ncbi:hypothetical protein [Streptomyces kaniharaensis]|nr:hypothetical protein [Streptomyces kaniharaensis]
MDERVIDGSGARMPEGRMSQEDTERFRQLLAGLENSLAADREVVRRDG